MAAVPTAPPYDSQQGAHTSYVIARAVRSAHRPSAPGPALSSLHSKAAATTILPDASASQAGAACTFARRSPPLAGEMGRERCATCGARKDCDDHRRVPRVLLLGALRLLGGLRSRRLRPAHLLPRLHGAGGAAQLGVLRARQRCADASPFSSPAFPTRRRRSTAARPVRRAANPRARRRTPASAAPPQRSRRRCARRMCAWRVTRWRPPQATACARCCRAGSSSTPALQAPQVRSARRETSAPSPGRRRRDLLTLPDTALFRQPRRRPQQS